MTITFVGLGKMGFHLARHVCEQARSRGAHVRGYDIDPNRRAEANQAYGLDVVEDLETALRESSVMCLSVPDGTAVEQVLSSQRGGGVLAETNVLDFSSISPSDARRFSALMADEGGRYFDAPVTGGVAGAEEGTLTTMVGGDSPLPADIEWVPASFSGRVVPTGPSGTGALLKSINNMIGNIASLVSMEGILLARAGGIADDVFLDVINNGPARTYFSAVRYPRYVLSNTFDAGMTLGLVNKDLGIALEAAMELGVQPPMSMLGREIWRTALRRAGRDADTTRIIDTVSLEASGRGWGEAAEA